MTVQGFPGRPGGRRARGDQGAALVEFALILPILALLVFGTIDLARAYSTKNQLTNMAREGGGVAFDGPCPIADVVAAAKAENDEQASAVTVRVAAGGSSSDPDLTCPATGTDEVTVVVERKMTILTPLVSAVVGNSEVTLRGTSTVKIP